MLTKIEYPMKDTGRQNTLIEVTAEDIKNIMSLNRLSTLKVQRIVVDQYNENLRIAQTVGRMGGVGEVSEETPTEATTEATEEVPVNEISA